MPKKTEPILALRADHVFNILNHRPENGPTYRPLSDYSLLEQLMDRNHSVWIPRYLLEEDESYLQLIPYTTFTCGHRDEESLDPNGKSPGRKIALYPRHGSEKRLHGTYAAGFGGHIDLSDMQKDTDHTHISMKGTLRQAQAREVQEELGLSIPSIESKCEKWGPRTYGIIYDPTEAVGRVHLGFHMNIHLRRPFELEPESDEEIRTILWRSVLSLQKDPLILDGDDSSGELERWTQLIINQV